MTKTAEAIKQLVEIELSKQGKTLLDFEDNLKDNLEKTASGSGGPSLLLDPSHVGSILKSFANIYGGSALGMGLLGGTGLYAAHLANEDSTNQQLKHQKERDQYLDASKSLQDKIQHPDVI